MTHAVESMAYANQVPWHGLGVNVSEDMSVEQMLKAAGLDWTVEKRPVYIKNGNGKMMKVDGEYALTRDIDDQVLTMVGSTWKEVQNSDSLDFFDRFVREGHMKMETAGSLWDGRYVWGLARVGKDFALGKGSKADEVRSYLLLLNPHVFGKAGVALLTPTRVVCWNTLNLALGTSLKGGESAFRMPHTKAFNDEVKKAAEEALGLAGPQMDEFKDAATLLSKKKAKAEDVEEFYFEVLKFDPEKAVKKADGEVREPKMLPMMRHALEHAPGQQLPSALGTWWGAFNSVTYVIDHEVGKSRDTALKGAWVGSHAELKRKAFKLAVEKAV